MAINFIQYRILKNNIHGTEYIFWNSVSITDYIEHMMKTPYPHYQAGLEPYKAQSQLSRFELPWRPPASRLLQRPGWDDSVVFRCYPRVA